MRKFFLGVSSIVFAAVSTLSNTALAQTTDQAKITGFAYGGSGCAQGTVGNLISASPEGLPDTLTLLFDAYEALQGAGVSSSERQKSCNIAINIDVPQGFSFSLLQAEYKGYADLPVGVRGIQRTTYEFPFSNRGTFETELKGPYEEDYRRTDEVGTAVWSPCGGSVPLNLQTSVALRGDRKPNASMNVERFTGKLTQLYNFQWRQCSN